MSEGYGSLSFEGLSSLANVGKPNYEAELDTMPHFPGICPAEPSKEERLAMFWTFGDHSEVNVRAILWRHVGRGDPSLDWDTLIAVQ